jgi:hypothetical protein
MEALMSIESEYAAVDGYTEVGGVEWCPTHQGIICEGQVVCDMWTLRLVDPNQHCGESMTLYVKAAP